MDRIENVLEMALKKINNDRYKLSCLVFSRVKELSDGAKPLVNIDMRNYKLTDIALMEIAEDKISLDIIEGIQ